MGFFVSKVVYAVCMPSSLNKVRAGAGLGELSMPSRPLVRVRGYQSGLLRISVGAILHAVMVIQDLLKSTRATD
jgi:hypothetical protein